MARFFSFDPFPLHQTDLAPALAGKNEWPHDRADRDRHHEIAPVAGRNDLLRGHGTEDKGKRKVGSGCEPKW